MAPPEPERPLFGSREAIKHGGFTDWQARTGMDWQQECKRLGLDPDFMDEAARMGVHSIALVILSGNDTVTDVINAQLRSFMHLGFAMGREYERRHGDEA